MTWLSQILSNKVRGCAIILLHQSLAMPAEPGIQGRCLAACPGPRYCGGDAQRHCTRDLCFGLGAGGAALAPIIVAPALGDAGRLAAAAAQVIELGPAHR